MTSIDDRFVTANNAINLGGDLLHRTNIDCSNSRNDLDLESFSFWIKTSTIY